MKLALLKVLWKFQISIYLIMRRVNEVSVLNFSCILTSTGQYLTLIWHWLWREFDAEFNTVSVVVSGLRISGMIRQDLADLATLQFSRNLTWKSGAKWEKNYYSIFEEPHVEKVMQNLKNVKSSILNKSRAEKVMQN